MLVLNKKRILIVLACMFVSTIAIQFNGIKNVDTKETVALPVNNKVIILDAGHGRRRWWSYNR